MTSENTLTGRNGKKVVDSTLLARTKEWNITRNSGVSEWGDSDSGGYTNRAPGRRDATFTSSGVYDTTNEVYDLFQPEDIALVTLWMDATSLYWDFPRALNSEFSIAVNVDTEEIIGWTSNWGADGIFYHPGASGAPVRTLP